MQPPRGGLSIGKAGSWSWRSLRSRCAFVTIALLATLLPRLGVAAEPEIQVGSKRFTESYILGEIVTRTAQTAAPAVHKQGLGNTAVVTQALQAGAIDVYPEYLGTIDAEILHNPKPTTIDAMRKQLAAIGLDVGVPLGFVNSYALAMTRAEAQRLHIATLSDLASHPEVNVGLSHEFLGRADGWPGLASDYGLKQKPIGIEHGISYDALSSGRIAVTDIYSTDAKIAALGLVVLEDDKHYFPRYDAVLLFRADAPKRFPVAWKAIASLEGRVTQDKMIQMNGDAELRGQSFATIAQAFMASAPASAARSLPGASTDKAIDAANPAPTSSQPAAAPPPSASSSQADTSTPPIASPPRASFWSRLVGDDLWRLTREHLLLVVVGTGVAALLGVPLGALAAALPRLEQTVMAIVGLLQTIPSLALLAMLIPLLGRIGTVPALVALALYALLPIVRNTTTGLSAVPQGVKQAGTALGLTPAQRWRSIDLPLAAPVIMAGLKTAAVISVGTATIAAFIGAGGYGERIATGLALNDHDALLAGAIPAAVMALLVQGVFELAERALVKGQVKRS